MLEQVVGDLPERIDADVRGSFVSRMHSEVFETTGVDIQVSYLLTQRSDLEPQTASGVDFILTELVAVSTAATILMAEPPPLWHLGTTAIGQWIEVNDHRMVDMQREVWHELALSGDNTPVVELQWPIESSG